MTLDEQLKEIAGQIDENNIKLHEIKSKCMRYASDNDFTNWTAANSLLRKVENDLGWQTAKKEGLEFKLRESEKAELEKKAELRKKALTALCDSKKAIRNRFDRVATNLVNLLKDTVDLHERSINELDHKSEAERQVFLPETDYQHFFLALNSHHEASDFLKLATKMAYPPVDGKRKMKDYYHDLG